MTTLFRLDASSLPANLMGFEVTAPASKKDHRHRLRIFIDNDSGKYNYKFDDDEVVFRHAEDNITFYLVNEIPNSAAAIVKHVSTDDKDPSSSEAKLVLLDPNDTNATPSPLPDPTNAFPALAARFKLRQNKIGTNEMLHIGLIVAVKSNSGELTYMLCDPQVGNGPP